MKYAWQKKEKERKGAALKIYLLLRKDFIADNPRCKANLENCTFTTEDVHHRGLRGKNLNNVDLFMSVCRNCHIDIHKNSKRARELNCFVR